MIDAHRLRVLYPPEVLKTDSAGLRPGFLRKMKLPRLFFLYPMQNLRQEYLTD